MFYTVGGAIYNVFNIDREADMTDIELLGRFISHVKEEGLCVNYAQIHRGSELTAEYSRLPFKTRLNVWSVSKGVVSCAAGIAIGEGLISLDERICDIFPEYVPAEPGEYLPRITVRNMLTMTSGLADPLFMGDGDEKYTVEDWIGHFFNARFDKEPGTSWLYSNFHTYIVSCAIERRAGMNLLEYLRPRLFKKIDIGNPEWTLCPRGHVYAANGLYLTIDELSRFGEMVTGYGEYRGRRVVPEAYLREATENLVDNSTGAEPANETFQGKGYGYQFVQNPGNRSWRSEGNYGQFCVMIPEGRTVVTVMSLDGDYNRIGTLLWQDIIGELDAQR